MNEESEVQVEEGSTEQVQAEAMSEQPDRPEWLPEKFERPEELANSYKELERAFYSRKEELRNSIVNELNDEAKSNAPISPADYEVNFQAPDGMELTVSEDDPLLDWFRGKSHEYGLSQDEFNGLVSEWAAMETQRGPDWNVESESLGEHAERRLERVDSWAGKHLSENAYSAFANIPASANMVHLFEELMELNGQPRFAMTTETQFQERVTREDLMQMQQDPKYWKDKDPVFISKVRAGFEQLSRQ